LRFEFRKQQIPVGVWFRTSAEEQVPAVDGGYMDIKHLDAAELLQHCAGREPGRRGSSRAFNLTCRQ
jgi:hypothetical protein